MALLLGVDVGTGSIKAALFDSATGRALRVAKRPTVTRHPEPGRSELDPEDMWSAVAAAVREAAGKYRRDVAAIAVASMGEAGVPMDGDGIPLYPFIAWHDPRTESLAQWWSERCDSQRLFEITGLAPRHIYGLNKLLWVREHLPERYARMRHWLSIGDFILHRLTGRLATDYTLASRTMAFDQRRRDWSHEVLGLAEVPLDLWPEALPSGSTVGPLTKGAAAQTGLSGHTVAVTGGHDHLCAALAAGLLAPEVALDSMGTAEALLTVAPDFTPSPSLRQAGLSCYSYVVRGRYVVQAGLSAAGGSLTWLADLVGRGVSRAREAGNRASPSYEDLLQEAATAPPGAHGLLWLPHLLGSGSPENDPASRGALLGLTTRHARADIVRALLEALCYWQRQNVALLGEQLGGAIREVIAVGGVTRSAFWRQLKADVTGLPVRVPELAESAALGAALLAGVGCGAFADEPEAVASVRRSDTIYQPNAELATLYERLYRELYLPAYGQLRELSHRLAQLQR